MLLDCVLGLLLLVLISCCICVAVVWSWLLLVCDVARVCGVWLCGLLVAAGRCVGFLVCVVGVCFGLFVAFV